MDLTLAEEPYDSADAQALVAALNDEITERYAFDTVGWTDEERAEDEHAYLAEVTPELVRPPDGAFVVARLDGEAVACGALKALDDAYRPLLEGVAERERVGEIKRMFTHHHARGRGISRQVLSHLEARAAALGYQRLVLETGTAQPEALALYESEGWARIKPYGHYRDSPASVCFAKAIVPAA